MVALQPTVFTKQWLSRAVAILNGDRYSFPINPEDEQTDLPSRAAVYNTLSGAYLEMWGAGVESYVISGSTGYRQLHDGEGDGFQAFIGLKNMHRTYQNLCATGDPAQVQLLLIIPPYAASANQVVIGDQSDAANGQPPILPVGAGNPGASGGVYRVHSDTLQIFRNERSPLLFRYRWQFTVLEDLLFPMQAPGSRFNLTAASNSAPGANAGTAAGLIINAAASISNLVLQTGATTYQVPSDGSITSLAQIQTANGPLTAAQQAAVVALNQLPSATGLTPGETLQIPANLTLTGANG